MLFTKVLKRSGWLRSEGHQPPLSSIQTPKMSPEQPYYDSSSGGWRSSFPLNFSPVARRGAWVRGRAYLSLPVLTCCTWFQPVWVSECLTNKPRHPHPIFRTGIPPTLPSLCLWEERTFQLSAKKIK